MSHTRLTEFLLLYDMSYLIVCIFSVKLQSLMVELNYYSFPMFKLNEDSVSHSSFTLTGFTVSLVFDAR